jgi:hypothetical protein
MPAWPARLSSSFGGRQAIACFPRIRPDKPLSEGGSALSYADERRKGFGVFSQVLLRHHRWSSSTSGLRWRGPQAGVIRRPCSSLSRLSHEAWKSSFARALGLCCATAPSQNPVKRAPPRCQRCPLARRPIPITRLQCVKCSYRSSHGAGIQRNLLWAEGLLCCPRRS